MRWLLAFLAGFVATLIFHQGMLSLLYSAGVSSRGAFSMEATPPFGIPSVISLAFWGGVWGIPLYAAIRKIERTALFLLVATIFGAILPTLVAVLVVMPLKGIPTGGGNRMAMLMVGLLVNAAWGLGTALLLLPFRKRELPSERP